MSPSEASSPAKQVCLITRGWKGRAWPLAAPALESDRPGLERGAPASCPGDLRHGTYPLGLRFLNSKSGDIVELSPRAIGSVKYVNTVKFLK